MEFKSPQRDLLNNSFSLSLSWPPCTNNNQTGPTIFWYKMAFSPSCVPRKHLKESLWTFFVLSDVECIKAFKGGRQICLNIQLRKERANSGKKTAPKFNTCLQPFLVFVSMVSTTSLNFALGFFMFQNNVFWASLNGFLTFRMIVITIFRLSLWPKCKKWKMRFATISTLMSVASVQHTCKCRCVTKVEVLMWFCPLLNICK